jgi:hypothetical protein
MPAPKRSEERTTRVGLVRYSIAEVTGGTTGCLPNFAISVNVSSSGVSFLSLKPVERMTSIRLSSDRLWDYPREGVVRWCSEVAPGSYRVGVLLVT